MSDKRNVLLYLLISCFAIFASSCDEIMQKVAEKNCTDKSTNPAGPDKRVLLFAKNHIYVVGRDARYDPDMITRHPHSGLAWKNEDLVKFRSKQINDGFTMLNNILKDNNANIYVHHSGYDIRVVTQDQIKADLDEFGVICNTSKLVNDTIRDPDAKKYIHVHWLWTSTSRVIAVGVPSVRSIVIGDDPISGDILKDTGFTHEFVHALGYETHINDFDNLMDGGGTALNSEQLQIIWTSLNRQNDKLIKLSCDK